MYYFKLLRTGFFFAFSILWVGLSAQETLPDTISVDEQSRPTLFVKTRTHDNGIDIRWAPNDHLLFRTANRKGYRLEKKETGSNKWEVVFDRAPYSVEEFKAKLDTTNVHVATAAQCIHGAPQAPTNPSDYLSSAKEIEEEQIMRHGFALMSADYNKQAAEGLALYYRDDEIVSGKSYLYKLYIRDMDEDFLIDTASFYVNTMLTYKPAAVQKMMVIPEHEQIVIKWSKEANNPFFSGYYIERSADEGRTFKRLNSEPLITSDSEEFDEFNIFHMYSDKDVVPGQKYAYRIVGITPFADEGNPSEIVHTEVLDNSGPKPPSQVESKDQLNGSIKISWEAVDISPDQIGYQVWRSDQPTGPFYPIHETPLPNISREYIDLTPVPIRSNYYIVYAVNSNGNKSGSPISMAVWYDNTPPDKPEGLAGYIDTTGLVTLAWVYGKEADLNGYFIYWSNGPDREFYPISDRPVEGNIFLDSINLRTSTEKIYYKIIAVDFNMNQSEPSDVLELEKPDLNPPARPMLTDAKAYTDSIFIAWSPSPSEDVVAYQILRKLSGAEKYDILDTRTDLENLKFMDKNVQRGVTYQYAIIAIDDAMHYSELSEPYTITSLRGMRRIPISDFNGRIIESTAEFELSWNHKDSGDYEYVIYRNVDSNGWLVIATLDKSQQYYIDRNLYRSDTGFKYAVKAVYRDGGESPLSNIVALNFSK